jgi:hypothetical protein
MSTIEQAPRRDDETERSPLYDFEEKQRKQDKYNRNYDPMTHSVDNCDISPG